MVKAKLLWIENTVFACLFVVFFLVCVSRHSHNLTETISSDTKGYYMYLPSLFIYEGVHHLPEKDFTGNLRNSHGELYTKFTCGIAFFYLPFFLGAHLYANIFHLSITGFSEPYSYAIMLCGVFWAFTGLFILKALLLKYFDRTTTWITLLCIMLGTNFYFYATYSMGMSHVYNFTLFAAAVLLAHHYYKEPSKSKAMLMGLLIGWIVLTRPTNAAILIFLFLFHVTTWQGLKERMNFYKKRVGDVFVAMPFVVLPFVPQMLYWKEMTGKWIDDSYSNEHFLYWAQPKIAAVLFDTQNGLFLYSPVLLLMFWALVIKRNDPRSNFPGVTIVFAIITYLFASWWAWWFGGAFGHRCYIDYYPLFAFPIAVTIEALLQVKKSSLKLAAFSAIIACCYYNITLSHMFFVRGIWDGPEWRWNWHAWLGLVRDAICFWW